MRFGTLGLSFFSVNTRSAILCNIVLLNPEQALYIRFDSYSSLDNVFRSAHPIYPPEEMNGHSIELIESLRWNSSIFAFSKWTMEVIIMPDSPGTWFWLTVSSH